MSCHGKKVGENNKIRFFRDSHLFFPEVLQLNRSENYSVVDPLTTLTTPTTRSIVIWLAGTSGRLPMLLFLFTINACSTHPG